MVMAFVVLLSGCKKADGKSGNTLDETQAEINTEKNDSNSEATFFPVSYEGGTEKVTFDVTLEIPETFDPSDFYLPKVEGLQCVDQEAATKIGVGDQEVKDQLMYPKNENYIADQYYYFLADDTTVGIDTGFSIFKEAASCYAQAAPQNERDASRETFSFGTAENYIRQIKEMLSAMDYPTEELRFDWFSVNKDEYQELEKQYLAENMIEPDKTKGEWLDSDNVYEIYAWQVYGGLPVFQEYTTTRIGRAFESYQKAQVSATCSEQGILSLTAIAPYKFVPTQEKAEFLPFSDVAAVVEQKYENLLDEAVYTVYRAKLALRIYYDTAQQYAAEPVWYFEARDSDGKETVILVNALTGKEIYMDP